MNENNFIDSYLKYMLIVLATVVLLYFGQALFIPLSFGLLIAFILYPLCHWLEMHKWPKSIAILIALILVMVLFIGLVWLFIWQLKYLKDDLPFLANKLHIASQQLQQWFHENIGVVFSLKSDWLQNITRDSGEGMGSFIKATLRGLANGLFSLFIIPVFSALFLYNRQQFVQFMKSMFNAKYHHQLYHILHESSHAYSKNILGRKPSGNHIL